MAVWLQFCIGQEFQLQSNHSSQSRIRARSALASADVAPQGRSRPLDWSRHCQFWSPYIVDPSVNPESWELVQVRQAEKSQQDGQFWCKSSHQNLFLETPNHLFKFFRTNLIRQRRRSVVDSSVISSFRHKNWSSQGATIWIPFVRLSLKFLNIKELSFLSRISATATSNFYQC